MTLGHCAMFYPIMHFVPIFSEFSASYVSHMLIKNADYIFVAVYFYFFSIKILYSLILNSICFLNEGLLKS